MAEPTTGGAFVAIEPMREAELPPPTLPFWKMTGPGAILVGLSIGAGEIIVWPRLTAQYGAGMTWAAVVGVFLQLWVNFEIGRWTIATGETMFTGYARVWRGFAPLFILFTMLGWLAPGWARASGLALKALLLGPGGWGSDTVWTAITFALIALLLFGPKVVYRSVELTVEVLVLIVVAGLLTLALAVGTLHNWADLATGALNFGYVAPGMNIKDFFSALVFAGAGGTANLFYCYYLRDKHIGMGAHVPSLRNRLRDREEAVGGAGFTFAETPANVSAFRAWMRYVVQDQAIFFWALNTFTILLFIFGALAVLHPLGAVPAAGTLMWDEAEVLGRIWGGPGRTIFLLVGFATLFSTQLALLDGVARSLADLIHTQFTFARRRPLNWWYMMLAVGWMLAGVALTAIMEQCRITELGFVLNAAYMGGFAMAVYVPLTLYINHRYLPRAARPGPVCTVMMTIASLVYLGFAIACVLWQLKLI